PADAARLLQAGEKNRAPGPASARATGLGGSFASVEGAIRVEKLEPHSPASRSMLRLRDVVVKVNGVGLTALTPPHFAKMVGGDVGKKVRLTVRHAGGTTTENVDLVTESYFVSDTTARLFYPLAAALEKRLAENPGDAGLLELRAELAGQES